MAGTLLDKAIMKIDLGEPEQEKIGYRHPKPYGALWQSEKEDPTDRGLDNVIHQV